MQDAERSSGQWVQCTSRSSRSPASARIRRPMTVQDHDPVNEHPQDTVDDHLPVITRRTAMRQLFLLGISLLAVAACAPQPAPPPAVAGQAITPVSYASGSPANTTRAFDGTFKGLAVQSVAGGSIYPGGEYGFGKLPKLYCSLATASDHLQRPRTVPGDRSHIPGVRYPARWFDDELGGWSKLSRTN